MTVTEDTGLLRRIAFTAVPSALVAALTWIATGYGVEAMGMSFAIGALVVAGLTALSVGGSMVLTGALIERVCGIRTKDFSEAGTPTRV